MRTIEWKDGTVVTIDQTKLPHTLKFLHINNCKELSLAISEMRLRGAPLLGVAAAYGLALTAYHSKAKEKKELLRELENAANMLMGTRPTAVNLFWAVNRVLKKAKDASGDVKTVVEVVVKEAQKTAEEDVEVNRRIGEHGSKLIDDGDVVLTHCNAGSLATVDYGTALGVIRTAWKQGKQIEVIATETRPKLQGARLTAFELKRDGIPVTLITDSTVGYAMSRGLIKKVVVGADRIVQDAVINKIGTYTIAVLADEHSIPFYAAAPTSTFDLVHTSKEVAIEERDPEEITSFGSQRIAPNGVDALNPAFDATPLKYVSAIICENGVLSMTDFGKLVHSSGRV
ncbi:MAG: S-methyl-5-thioribose-1-phosphate isomerase [Candidatus Bathyarchaeota archaeon]|nr:S-methyl-5-thioribose-1-phosphate isomerase [Candidatus Bathyarchaeota archaeon]MDH5733838.1 S-methyl-5-thioribose-1-phosphate isomerase [Candidatus Bathyarchaeota archaeon]